MLVLTAILCYTASFGDVRLLKNDQTPGGQSKIIEFSDELYWLLVFVTLIALWWLSFLVKLNEFTVAGSLSNWYFSKDRTFLYVMITQKPIWRSLGVCFRYHLGSIVLAAVLRPMIIIPQTILEFFYDFARNRSGFWKRLLCVKFYFTTVRFFPRNALIIMAMFGKDYFETSK